MEKSSKTLRVAIGLWRKNDAEGLRLAQTISATDLFSWEEAFALGNLLNLGGRLEGAYRAFAQAAKLSPNHVPVLQAYADAMVSAGEFDKAREALNRAIKLEPGNVAVLYALAQSKKHTDDRLRSMLQERLNGKTKELRDRVPLHYALAKVLDDLGEFGPAFEQFIAGANVQRSHIKYSIDNDLRAIDKIRTVFHEQAYCSNSEGFVDDSMPVFVVGLPRSGTTLVERILTSHTSVSSIGESPAFTYALTDCFRKLSGGSALPRIEAIQESVKLNPVALGNAYMESVLPRLPNSGSFVDKMPLNFLYVGLIRKSLPNAKIIVVRRRAADNCWAMFSTLFRNAYPFSYEFSELTRYYAGFSGLADHWGATIQDGVTCVDYEVLVAHPEEEIRRIISSLGLEWQESCLEFHKNKSSVATASATQVRKPIYQSSVGRWKNYGSHLSPLLEQLDAAGLSR